MFTKSILVFMLFTGVILIIGGCTLPPLIPTVYNITVTAGAGGQIDPEGEVEINEGGNQTFTITPDEGYQIADVLVDDESVGAVEEYTFQNIRQDHTIYASFVQQTQPPIYTYYKITATTGTGGQINPEGEIGVQEGRNRTFTITPDEGYQIDDVLVDSASVGKVGTYTFENVKQDHTIHASFIPLHLYTLTMVVAGEGDVTPVIGTYTYTGGTVVIITATPLSDCFSFSGWSGDVTNPANAVTTVTMDSDKTVTANFVARKAYNADTGDDYDTVQEAIDAATDGDTIIVCPGTYVENIEFNGRDITVQSADPSDPDTTIIDGGGSGSVVTFTGGDTSSLEGFTIQNGNADEGSGIYVFESSPIITGNTITGNTITGNTSTGEQAEYTGAGICVNHNSSPIITGNIITGNTITGDTTDEHDNNGGGIAVHDNSSPIITGNTIENNSTTHLGGGIYVIESSPSIAGNIITGNSCSDSIDEMGNGGGIAVVFYSSPTIEDNQITGNTAAYNGGGIYVNWHCSPTITGGNTITGNTAAYNGGGISVKSASTPTISGNTINGNTATNDGGGISIIDSTPTITGNTIGELSYGNTAANYGGGIHVYDSSPTITDNDITYNTAALYGGGIYVSPTGNLLPATDRPIGWGIGRENIPAGDPLDPLEGVVYTIAGNDFIGNTHNPSDYTGGAHVFFEF